MSLVVQHPQHNRAQNLLIDETALFVKLNKYNIKYWKDGK